MAFSSKGFRKQAKKKERELNEALLSATRNGKLPVICDMSPCLLHMRETLDPRLKLYDQVDFIHDFLLDRLQFTRQSVSIAIHNTCSTTKMQIEDKFYSCSFAMCRKGNRARKRYLLWLGRRSGFLPSRIKPFGACSPRACQARRHRRIF